MQVQYLVINVFDHAVSECVIFQNVWLTSAQCGIQNCMAYIHYLNMDTIRCKGCGILDCLIKLVALIHQAFLNSKVVLAAFFNMERGYEIAWRENILQCQGINGNTMVFLHNFLQDQTFYVHPRDTVLYLAPTCSMRSLFGLCALYSPLYTCCS